MSSTLRSAIGSQAGLIFALAKTDFLQRNERSYLGIFWYLLGPVLTFIILYLVFSHRLGAGVDNYPLYLLCGIVVWNFFGAASAHSLNAIISQAGLIKSIPVRKDSLVIAVVLDISFSHLFEIIIFLGFAFYFKVLSATALFFPIILLIYFFFVLGVSFALAALQCVFRDLSQIWSVFMKAWWFATPIFYVLYEGGKGEKVSTFNPMFHVIDLSRDVLIYGKVPQSSSMIILASFAALAMLLGLLIFKKLSPRFAELVI